jgi:hypothetical protein
MSQRNNLDKELESFFVKEQKEVQGYQSPLENTLLSTPFTDPIRQPGLATRHPSPPMLFVAVPPASTKLLPRVKSFSPLKSTLLGGLLIYALVESIIRNKQPERGRFEPKTTRNGQLVCIAFQTSYFPGLCKVGSHLMARYNLREFHIFEGQVGRIIKIQDKGLVHIVFNLKKGPFLKLNTRKPARSVLSPFLLLHESRWVDVRIDGRIPKPIYLDRFTDYREKECQEKQCI